MKYKIPIILVILWTLFIFGQSSLSGEVSSDQSGFIVDVLYPFMSRIGININQDTFSFIIRKLAHFTEYFILGSLLHLIYLKFNRGVWFIFLHGFITACMDETLQLFIPNRSGELRDVMIDTSGVLLSIVVVFILMKIIKKEAKIK